MMRSPALLLVLILAGCELGAAPADPGAVRVRTSLHDAVLYVDARERGSLMDDEEVELSPGPHVLEARRDDRVIARRHVEIQSRRSFEVRLDGPNEPAAAAPPPQMPAPAEEPPAPPEPDHPSSAGELDAAQIRTVVARERGRMQGCFETWLRTNPEAPGGPLRIDCEISIGADGSVASVTTRGGDDGHATLRACMDASIRTWRFPASRGTTATSVPFVFSSSGNEPSQPPVAPATPTRAEIVSAMGSIAPAVRRCGSGHSGTVPVRIVFASDGSVSSAEVQGGDLPDAVRSCIAREGRGARVPPFSQSSFTVSYPFRL